MGLLDSLIGGLTGGSAGASGGGSPIAGALMSMLGGGQGQQQMGGGMMGQGQPIGGGMGGMGGGGMGGGLGGLISAFEGAGLGHIAQSWIGNGPNQPVSPSQLESVFGQNQVQSMASQAGMQPHDFLSQLSQHLPSVVDGMTPGGRMPDEGTVSV